MSSLIGVLVDVSGSMKTSVGGQVEEEGGAWARSIFKVIDELIEHDVPSSNQIFALAFGGSSGPAIFDLLGTVKANDMKAIKEKKGPIEDLKSWMSKREMIEESMRILERNGARRIWKWAKMNVLLRVIEEDTAVSILYNLRKSSDFANKFVYKCLPRECIEISNMAAEGAFALAGFADAFLPFNSQEWATESSVREAIEKGKQLMVESYEIQTVVVSKAAIMSVRDASEILHASVDEETLTDNQVDDLLKVVEPVIYGGTPLMKTMRHSVDLFSYPEFANHQKLLFVLSDGQPSDGDAPPLQELANQGVTVVSCFITHQKLANPRRLFSIQDSSWEKPAKFMFRMSSTIKTQSIPRTLFVKRGWTIDIDNNETRLFFQVNHPDIIKDVCQLAKTGVLTQDALSDVLSSVDLDIYINKANDGFEAKRQHGGTCYANATAAVLDLAMKRIIGRDGGYPNFFKLRKKLIAKYGKDGAPTMKVLQEICPEYRLQCQKVDAVGAMKALSAKRPVVARFRLNGAQWDQFSLFFDENPKGILTKTYLDSKTHSTSPSGGHAVVLTSYDAESFRLMNSWGDGWADNGFFRVQNADVLGLEFSDVFWTLNDLSDEEKKAYDKHGSEVAAKLMRSLKGLQEAKYRCPLTDCGVESKVVEYSGHLLKAKCPSCGGTFNANQVGGDLALNLYLASLTH